MVNVHGTCESCEIPKQARCGKGQRHTRKRRNPKAGTGAANAHGACERGETPKQARVRQMPTAHAKEAKPKTGTGAAKAPRHMRKRWNPKAGTGEAKAHGTCERGEPPKARTDMAKAHSTHKYGKFRSACESCIILQRVHTWQPCNARKSGKGQRCTRTYQKPAAHTAAGK